MNRRQALAAFRKRQSDVQLAVSTLSPAVVLVKTGEDLGFAASLECRFRTRARQVDRYDVWIREHLQAADNEAEVDWYSYVISASSGAEILSYHLHPANGPHRAYHLHLGAGAGSLMPELATAHVPTGPVSAGRFVRFLVEDLGVRTLRADWQAVLEEFDA